MPTKIQKSPNQWSCLPTAYAMALNVKLAFVIKWLGHDGSRIIRPDAKDESQRHIGFHDQELISYCWWVGFAVTPFQPRPQHRVPNYEDVFVEFPGGNENRILQAMNNHIGVLTGQAYPSGRQHAVCWNGFSGKIYNPTGEIQDIGDFAINTFWCITPKQEYKPD